MNTRLAARKIVVSVLVCLGMVILCATMAHAQSGGTGAITGTLTDPQGRAVPNATVTATSAATNQARTATTGGSGDYKFSLLPPGAYSLKFTAAGFKTTDVSGVTVTTTETTTVDKILEVGTVTQTVTVESTVETLQTENSTLGTTVTGGQITALPMANGNYTEILSLTAGTTASVDNATVLGKGTQDISANGADPGQNNYQMDGVAVNNIANSGSSNDGTIYTGIPIPSPDAIQEFKVQTSTYDASYGRNPGANVNVTTKSGSNNFHGSAFEYFRNTVLNANDFFLKQGQLAEGSANTRPALDQNQFGATLGGPIKKDKFFFFFSYRGTRSKNGDAPQGQDFGAQLYNFGGAIPTAIEPYTNFGAPETNTGAALGRGTCPAPPVPGAADTSPITVCSPQAQAFAGAMGIDNIVALRLFQLTIGKNAGVPNNYYIPSPASYPEFCDNNPASHTFGVCNFDIPAIYTENQYVANGDYIFNSKNTLSTKYFYTHNPYTTYLGQAGGDLPGTPEGVLFGNQAAVLKLTTLVTSTFVNEARVSYQQNENGATVAVPPGGCPGAGSFQAPFGCGSPQALGMVPLVPGFYEPPSFLNVGTNYGLYGGLLPDKGPTNQLQAADQISWSHGKHSIRAGYEYEWTNWPLEDAGLQQGLMLILGYSSFLGPATNTGGWNLGCLFCVKSTSGNPLAGVIHFYQLNNQDTYVLDDWKVSSRLTINMGLRWEYDGLLSDKYGHLTQVWLNRMAANSQICTGPPPLSPACAAAGVQQYVVPSNFATSFPGALPDGVGQSRNRNSVEGHAPYSDFAPRLGFAWQPLGGGKMVVRGGAGIFYDRVGEDRVVHAFEQGYPYAATYDFGFGSPRWAQSTLAVPYPAISLVCLPSDPNCNSEPNGLGFAPRFADPATANNSFPFGFQTNSGLNTPLDPTSVHIPLVREYSLGVQYEFLPQWVLEVGYVGSSGINLTDYNHNHNGATLFSPCGAADITGACASDPLGICTGTTMANAICNTSNNANFRVPVLGYEAIGLESSDNDGASNYNSLQVTVRHQFARGLSMQAAYTWDKDLSDVFFGNSANINNALCLRCQWGRVSFDRPQRFVVNYSYDLPFGKGTEGITNKLIAGWNVSGVTIAQGGDPLTIIDSGIPGVSAGAGAAYGTNTSLSFQGVATAQFCSGFNNTNVKNPGGIHENLGSYINPNAFNSVTCPAPIVPFGDPTAETYGNSGVGIVLGPGQFNWDISILKNTQITEKIKMQFRSDFYNAFNHTQFADPGSGGFGGVGFEDITSPTYNQITHVSVNPRLVQFGLHFIF